MTLEEAKARYEAGRALLDLIVKADEDARNRTNSMSLIPTGNSAEDRKKIDEWLMSIGEVNGIGKAYEMISAVVYGWKDEYDDMLKESVPDLPPLFKFDSWDDEK